MITSHEEYLQSEEYAARVREVAVEIKAVNFLNECFEKCRAQVKKLDGFMDGFDQNKVDPSLDANLEPYPEEEAPDAPNDEFATLIEDIENIG
ncbi:UNVERIFIED_CONTAM: hypothetical protein Sindi_2263300 [Sesamum indicum]